MCHDDAAADNDDGNADDMREVTFLYGFLNVLYKSGRCRMKIVVVVFGGVVSFFE